MDRQRLHQILESPEVIYVSYQNIPVWVDRIKENNLAEIRDLNSNLHMDVPIDELLETGHLLD